MQNTAEFWDNIAEKYSRSPISDMDAYEYTLGRTRTYLSPDDRVLEVGCGTGSTALLLAENVAEITASDISENMIAIAQNKAQEQQNANVHFVASDVFGAALDDGPYDAVLALNLLHLLEDPRAAIQRLHGLLKPGGFFISKTVCQPGAGSSLKFRLMKMAIPVMQWMGKAPYVNFMAIRELEELITSEGFDIVETGNFPPPSRFVVARKV